MTLHEAIIYILKKENKPLSAKEIAIILNKDKIYQRSDGNDIPISQIYARINKYPDIFFIDKSGLISYKSNIVKELIDQAVDLQKVIHEFAVRYKSNIYFSDFFVPFLFFSKRMLDNPDLIKQNFSFSFLKSNSFENDIQEFIKFLNIHSQIEIRNNFKIISKEFEENPDSTILHLIGNRINHLDLSVSRVAIKEFGQFFNEFIFTTTRQKIKSSQFITPKTVANLFYELCKDDITPNTKFYNPGAGFSSVPALLAQSSGIKLDFFGEEISSDVYFLSWMNLVANNISTQFFLNANSLKDNFQNQKFDLVISVPPFGSYLSDSESIKFSPLFKTKDLTLLFLQRIISSLAKNGRAFILVSENILYSKTKEYTDFRNYIVDRGLVEGILSLPSDTLKPFTGIKTSILILSNRTNSSSIFIDCENPQFYQLNNYGYFFLNYLKIAEEYIFRKQPYGKFLDPIEKYSKRESTVVPLINIIKNDYNLNVNRYLIDDEPDSSKIELINILTQYNGDTSKFRDDLKYVNIMDLNKTNHDFILKEETLSVIKDNQKGRLIDVPVLLVGSIPPNIKPTFFAHDKGPVIVSGNIYCFRVDTSKVDIEYLIFELSSNQVKKYLSAFSTGVTSLKRFSINDFLHLKVNLPSLKKQKEIAQLKKETLYAEKLNEAKEYAEKTGLSAKSEKELLGFVKHEIGNISGGILHDIKSLQLFLNHRGIEASEKISSSSNASSLESVFTRIFSNISDVENLMSNIQNIIDFGNSVIQKKNVKFIKYMIAELHKVSNKLKETNTQVFLGIDDNYSKKSDMDVLIDSKQFSVVIRNVLFNSIKHGYSDPIINKNIIFNLSSDEDFFYLNMINDGAPFATDFTLTDFLSFGGRSETSNGSGLGGYLINKVVQNHSGTIQLLDSGSTLFLDDYDTEPNDIGKNSIKVGVHFQIKLPKE